MFSSSLQVALVLLFASAAVALAQVSVVPILVSQAGIAGALLLEDNASILLLEDNTSSLCLEGGC
jgi:hypothetical protein